MKGESLGKIPPQAVELEETLLGSVLLCESLEFCLKTIKADEFYKDTHRIIYQAMEQLHNNRLPINAETVIYLLRNENKVEQVGGSYAITKLTDKGMAVPHRIDYYAKIIHQQFVARELIRISLEVFDLAYDPQSDVADIIDKLMKAVHRLESVNIFDVPKILHYERVLLKGMVTNSSLFLEYKSIIPDDLFLDKVHQKYWNVMKLLSDSDIDITMFSVEDILKESKNESSIMYLKEILEVEFKEEGSVEYIFSYLRKYYEKVQLNKMSDYLREYRFSKEPEELVEKLERYLDNIRTKDIQATSFASHLDSTFANIISQSKDGNTDVLVTGYNKLDSVAMFSTNDIVIVGAARGSGKTRMAAKMVYEILTRNEDVAACMICMEETADKIIRLFISIMTGLTDSQQQSKYYELTNADKQKILEAKNRLKRLDIEIIAHPVSIKQTNSIYSKFAKKRPTKRCVFVLDNLMLLSEANSEVKNDDMIAKELVYIKKKTGGLIFALHHFTKEQENFVNSQEAYRPKEGHLKGSTRIVDVADHVWLFNFPSKYADLVKAESQKPMIEIDGKKYKREAILKKLLITEFTKNRDGTNDEAERIIRFSADLGTLLIKEWR